MDNESVYKRIQDFFGNMDNISLLENPVDVTVQMQYFDLSGKVRGKQSNKEILAHKDDLFNSEITIAKKKKLLAQMAGIPSPEIYRTLETYAKQPDETLKEWAQLALQENKLLLESDLLECPQVFISTGLGGKGHKLRYFVVLFNRVGGNLQPFQQKIVHEEMEDALKRHNSELEEVHFMDNYTTMRVVVPLTSDLTRVFREGIDECNQFGNFLSNDFIVTNMKELSSTEIKEALDTKNEALSELEDDFPSIEEE
ncbi:MAG: hypothetical protein LBU62_04850 [Bacteroidales bacterium]|jgi:hypothetical protein|nr:hypothetical protein [Bacteroidales bacterium]